LKKLKEQTDDHQEWKHYKNEQIMDRRKKAIEKITKLQDQKDKQAYRDYKKNIDSAQ
jgi:hypothetical protein